MTKKEILRFPDGFGTALYEDNPLYHKMISVMTKHINFSQSIVVIQEVYDDMDIDLLYEIGVSNVRDIDKFNTAIPNGFLYLNKDKGIDAIRTTIINLIQVTSTLYFFNYDKSFEDAKIMLKKVYPERELFYKINCPIIVNQDLIFSVIEE
ncbi:MAG: hypothetical protein D3903_15135 [Candidatus Electrothrix sp. GM3_4]|nr:hypothetical protein [Candidatus Electrothrix sp. GM3_4]